MAHPDQRRLGPVLGRILITVLRLLVHAVGGSVTRRWERAGERAGARAGGYVEPGRLPVPIHEHLAAQHAELGSADLGLPADVATRLAFGHHVTGRARHPGVEPGRRLVGRPDLAHHAMSRPAPMKRIALLVPALVLGLAGCGGGASSGPSARSTAAAEHFLSTYVSADGAVTRKDQGGDVVSEGQAYAMLIAEIAGRDALVPTIWAWTRTHLQRPDKLLSWHADASGRVLDQESASDADILAAYALLRYRGERSSELHSAGKQLAAAVLSSESHTIAGVPIPLAGPWAVAQDQPKVDPSYWMPGVYSGLAKLTGDQRWSKAADAVVAMVARSSSDQLPPDWAVLQGDRYAAAGSDTSSGPQYGADAQRMPIWFAYGCSADAEKLAAGWWKRLRDHPGAQVRGLDGTAYDQQASVVALEGEAAAADAAGDSDAAARLRQQAADRGKASPGYYGDAWLALAGALQDGSLGC